MSVITGVMPVAPTIFTDDEGLDLDGQRRVLDFLIDGKADAVCILANYSEQFSLTDEERESVLRTTMEHLSGRLPVCVTTSHFSSRIAREVPQVNYVKIEMPQAADKLRSLAAAAGPALPGLFDAEEAITLIPDLEAGAQGTMSSCMVPDQLGRIVRDFHGGERDKAITAREDLLPFIHFENRPCRLRATKVLMKEGNIIASDRTCRPVGELHPDTRAQPVEMAKRKGPLILRRA